MGCRTERSSGRPLPCRKRTAAVSQDARNARLAGDPPSSAGGGSIDPPEVGRSPYRDTRSASFSRRLDGSPRRNAPAVGTARRGDDARGADAFTDDFGAAELAVFMAKLDVKIKDVGTTPRWTAGSDVRVAPVPRVLSPLLLLSIPAAGPFRLCSLFLAFALGLLTQSDHAGGVLAPNTRGRCHGRLRRATRGPIERRARS